MQIKLMLVKSTASEEFLRFMAKWAGREYSELDRIYETAERIEGFTKEQTAFIIEQQIEDGLIEPVNLQ